MAVELLLFGFIATLFAGFDLLVQHPLLTLQMAFGLWLVIHGAALAVACGYAFLTDAK